MLKRVLSNFGYRVERALKNHPFIHSVCRKIFNLIRRFKSIIFRGRHKVDINIDDAQRKYETSVKFDKDIKFSILVPLYNTPQDFLKEMIDSVINQTYQNWQLCLADGSDAEHGYVEEYVKGLTDKRISYVKLKKNLGISENTNACIDMAIGDYIALFDHDDLLHPSVLFKMMEAICKHNADFVYTDEVIFYGKNIYDVKAYHYKPDFSPDTLRSCNYICHFSAFSNKLLQKAGGRFDSKCDGSQDYDMILRLTENAECVYHIREALYFWRSHKASVASDISAKPYAITAAKRALGSHIDRIGMKGTVDGAASISTYKIQYDIVGNPLVSIVIANKDNVGALTTCIESIYQKSTYKNFEIIIAENNSQTQEIFDYYKLLQEKYNNLKIVTWNNEFNYSAINNFAVGQSKGDYIMLLNNNTSVISPDWIEQMLMFAQRSDVGAVGAKLYYPNNTIQHAGIIIGIGGLFGYSHRMFDRYNNGYMARASIIQNLSACSSACLLIKRDIFEKAAGFDESYHISCSDVDLCLRLRKEGYLIVFNPSAELYHYKSKSQKTNNINEADAENFKNKWSDVLKNGDPYYNPNFTLETEDFALK